MYQAWKCILRPGRFWVQRSDGGTQPVEFTADDVRGFHAGGRQMLDRGFPVPVPLDHDDQAGPVSSADRNAAIVRNNAGWVGDYRLDEGDSGPELWARLDIDGPVGMSAADVPEWVERRVKFVSPSLWPEITLGDGTDVKLGIKHVALTCQPIDFAQKPFGVALSTAGESVPLWSAAPAPVDLAWVNQPGPRSHNRWVNDETGRVVYSKTKPGSTKERIAAAEGDVDQDALRKALDPHQRRQLTAVQQARARAAWGLLQSHHGTKAIHRLREMALADVEAIGRGETHNARGQSLHDRLEGYRHILEAAGKEAAGRVGAAGEPWAGKGEPQAGQVYNAPTSALTVDPGRFQFKLHTNKAGVTDELLGIKTWNPDFAGVVSVWKDPADGKTYVVNGHHRHELASRLGVDGLAVRYVTAKSAQEARAIGALVNIAEGRGTAVDAAKFMRDTGTTVDDFGKHGVSLKGGLAKDAATLTALNDSAFDRVARGTLDPTKALAVARHLPDASKQEQLFRLLDKREDEGKDLSPKVIEEMAREMAATPSTTTTEQTLFGAIESEESLFVPRNELKASVRSDMAREVQDFLAVSSKRRAGRVAGAGNVLNPEENKKIAEESARVLNVYDTLVNRKGPISDALNTAAADYAKATTRSQRDAVRTKAAAAVRDAVFKEAGVGKPTPPDGTAESPAVQGGGGTPAAGGASPAADAGGGAAEPAGLTPQSQPAAQPAAAAINLRDPQALADAVHEAGLKLPHAINGDVPKGKLEDWESHKPFISDLYDAMKGKLGGASLDDFKQALARANQAGTLELSRLDLSNLAHAQGKDAYGRSEIGRDQDTKHVVNVNSKAARKRQPAATPATGETVAKAKVEYVRAPSGGKVSDVDGKLYAGGQLMPVHGMYSGQERIAGKGDAASAPVTADEDAKKREPRQPAQPLTPDEIEDRRRRAEHQKKWDDMRSGPLGRMKWLGESPNAKATGTPTVDLDKWKEYAEKIGPEGVQKIIATLEPEFHSVVDKQTGDARRKEAERGASGVGKIPDDSEQWQKDQLKTQADESVSHGRGGKGHEKKVPGSHYARQLVQAMMEPGNHGLHGVDALHRINGVLADAENTPAPSLDRLTFKPSTDTLPTDAQRAEARDLLARLGGDATQADAVSSTKGLHDAVNAAKPKAAPKAKPASTPPTATSDHVPTTQPGQPEYEAAAKAVRSAYGSVRDQDGLATAHDLYAAAKRVHPGLTPATFKDALVGMQQGGEAELHTRNEVRSLTPEQTAVTPFLGDRAKGFVALKSPAKMSHAGGRTVVAATVRGTKRPARVQLSHGANPMADEPEADLFTDAELEGDDDTPVEDEAGDVEEEGTSEDSELIQQLADAMASLGLVVEPGKTLQEFAEHLLTAVNTHKATRDGGTPQVDDAAAQPEPEPMSMSMSKQLEARLARVEGELAGERLTGRLKEVAQLERAGVSPERCKRWKQTLQAKQLSLAGGTPDGDVGKVLAEMEMAKEAFAEKIQMSMAREESEPDWAKWNKTDDDPAASRKRQEDVGDELAALAGASRKK